MQSFNKLSSFGDNTLSACLKAEVKSIDLINSGSDMDKYFKDNTFFSKITNNSQAVDVGFHSKKGLHILPNVESQSKQNDTEHKECASRIIVKAKCTNANILKRSKTDSISCLEKDDNLHRTHKKNININHAQNDNFINENVVQKQCNKSELYNNNSNVRRNVTHNETDISNGKSCMNSVSISKSEKSLELNPSISIVPTQDRLKLASWGLPSNILQKYKARGVNNMFAWQVECLSNHKVIAENCNLIYSAPTSAGKTLVAEILMMKTVLEKRKKVIFILPFVSVVREKMYYFQDLLSDSGIRVEGFMGGSVPAGGFTTTQIAIATIEKANSLVNRLMEENELINLGAVIIDELHLVGDPNRGYLLELLLTKLKYMTLRDENINIQLIGMSATLPNLSLLAKWLDAELYKTDFRPIPLNEQCKIGKSIYDTELCLIRTLIPMPELKDDADDIFHLCIETISDGHSVLIFCPTKNWCEKLAKQLAATICKLGHENTELGKILRKQLDCSLISETLEQLKRTPAGLDNVLKDTVAFGTAYHHAGLTMDERDVIEGSFRTGSLRVLVATSTLSSGVNLPARRVIVRSPMFGGQLLNSLTYKQMIGRAGRMGKDTSGESILMCKPHEQKAACTLLSAPLEPIESCLKDLAPLIRALLEAIASEVVYTPADLELYTKCTLLSLTDKHNSKDPSTEAIKFLIDNEFLLSQNTAEGQRWVATAFGKACLAASVSPRDGLFLLEELQKARRCFVLDTELHVVYLVTPVTSGNQIGSVDWMTYLDLWKILSESERRVGQLVGVQEGFLTSAVKGIVRSGKLLAVHKRFYSALALHDLVREVPLNAVCTKYGCCRGALQSLQQSASTFAGMVTQFCKQLGWDCMELLVSQFQTRLQFGVCRELLDLLRLPMLNGLRARSLYKHGITTVADLAVANELDVERALYKAVPFESEKEHDGEHESEAQKRNKMRTVFVTGKDGLTPQEAAIMLVHEARTLVQNELGLQDISWKPNEQSVTTYSSTNEVSLQLQENAFQNINHANIGIISQTAHNSKDKVNSMENPVKEDNVICPPLSSHQCTDQDIHSDHIQQNALNSNTSDHERTNIVTNVTEGIKDSICKLEHIIIDEENIDNTEHNDQLLEIDILDVKPDVVANIESAETSENNCLKNNVMREEQNDNVKLINEELQVDNQGYIDSISGKISFDFFDVSSPCLISTSQRKRNSESLISFKDIRRCATQDHITKHSTNNVEKTEDINQMPYKKIRISNEAVATHGFSFKNGKAPVSRSPSLFDDSLNLDTQICDALEQNIIGSLHSSAFEDSKLSQCKPSPKSTSSKVYATYDVNTEMLVEKENISNKSILNSVNVQSKNTVLSWRDDSWNESKKITEKLKQIQNTNNEEELVKSQIRNIKNTNVLHSAETSEKNSLKNVKKKNNIQYDKPINTLDNLCRRSQKRKLKDKLTQSPVASVIAFGKNRASSFDSNKSDSDDFIISSQNTNSSTPSIKMRSKLDCENTQKGTKKVSTLIHHAKKYNADSMKKAIDIEEYKIKQELKDIHAFNLLSEQNCSADSIVSNSDTDTPVKTVKSGEKCKTIKRVCKVSKTCTPANELVSSTDDIKKWKMLNVIKVGSDRGTFSLFKREVMKKEYIALALNCELYKTESSSIGAKIISSSNAEKKTRSKKSDSYVHIDKKLCGAAICWESNIAYYISFSNEQGSKVPGMEQMKLLKEILSNTCLYIKCFSSKEVFKTLYDCCGIIATCNFLDPKVASWLFDGSIHEKSFNELVKEYFPKGCFITKNIASSYDTGPGMNLTSTVPGEFRASAESVLSWHITDTLLDKLEELNPMLLYTFKDVEMKTVITLACMELNGLGVSLKSLQDLSSAIREEMKSLEERAYAFCGKRFNFSSSKEVGMVLGLYKGKKISVNKAVLEQCDHPIANLIISWRKLNTTLSKIVYPVLNLAQRSPRIHGNCVTCTLTGRISMHEPNLQNVPRDFNSEDDSFTISVRMAFTPSQGNVMLSADYCQLELRILAHFSKDKTLCDIMRKPGDIFKNIAANWNRVCEDQVDDKMRQNTKQLCYGMIYGMGVKTLAENLCVDEIEAKEFLDNFMKAFPGISKWINNVLDSARKNGYVTTILERRRMIPELTSTNAAEKSHAERQAVNTKVQGSAADIAKKAMVNIEERIRFEFPTAAAILPTINSTRKLRSNYREMQKRGGYLVLQLHDEFLYEVPVNHLTAVARIVKESMEQICQLGVPLPVKLKVGSAWGDLSEYNF